MMATDLAILKSFHMSICASRRKSTEFPSVLELDHPLPRKNKRCCFGGSDVAQISNVWRISYLKIMNVLQVPEWAGLSFRWPNILLSQQEVSRPKCIVLDFPFP